MKSTKPKKIPSPTEKEHFTPEDLQQGLTSRIDFEKNFSDKLADFITSKLGTVFFLNANVVFFVIWMLYNLGYFPYKAIDPYPFQLLTTMVSLEAIFLSIIVLISQNRAGRIADIRQQLDFEIDVRSEDEITAILKMVSEIKQHLGMGKPNKELKAMIERTDLDIIRKEIEANNK